MLLLLPLLLSLSAQSEVARTPLPITTGSQADQITPGFATDGQISAFAWVDSATRHIRVSIGDGRGETWGTSARLDNDPFGVSKWLGERSVQVSGDRIYVCWIDSRVSGGGSFNSGQIYLARSMDRGLTWLPEIMIEPSGQQSDVEQVFMLLTPGLTSATDQLSFFMSGAAMDPESISSTDGGASFSIPSPIDPNYSYLPPFDNFQVFEQGNAVHVQWEGLNLAAGAAHSVFSRTSLDRGLTWAGLPTVLDPTFLNGTNLGIDIAAENGVLASTWVRENSLQGAFEVAISISQDQGATWLTPVVVSQSLAGVIPEKPQISILNGTITVLWQADFGSGNELNSTYSLNLGQTWSVDQNHGSGANAQLLKSNHDVIVLKDGAELLLFSDPASTMTHIGDLTHGNSNLQIVSSSYSPQEDHFSWAAVDTAGLQQEVSLLSFRPESLAVATSLGAGGPKVDFNLRQMNNDGIHFGGVLLSNQLGNYLISPTQNLGLDGGSTLIPQSLSAIRSGILLTALDTQGSGDILGLNIPPSFPAGTQFYAVALSATSSGEIHAYSDPVGWVVP